MLTRMSLSRNALRRGLPIGLVVALTLVVGQPPALADEPWTPPAQTEPLVPGTSIPVAARGPDPDAKFAVTGPRPVAWPAAETAVVDLAAGASPATAGGRIRAGGSPVWVGPTAAGSERRSDLAAPGQVKVEVLGQDQSRRLDLTGVLVRLTRADTAGVSAGVRPVAVEVDYSGFRHAGGGAWSSRLGLATVPACALTEPDRAGCAPVPLRSDNDVRTNRVTGTVTVPATGSAVFAVTAAAAGPSGNYGATALSSSATWSAGGSSGDFNWAYPIRVPPAVGGPAPQVSLAYSSGSVDGRTAATNNQPSWVGLGFEFWPGQIERKYRPCAEDMTGGNNANRPTGDQCWFSDNATMQLNGRGSELVRVGTSNVWRMKNDDGTRAELLTDGGRANDDNNGEYWRVTTADGTQYHFGYNRLPGWSGGEVTNSTFTTPVYGNHNGEPCWSSGGFGASGCRQAYRWNVDYVVDVHGNTMSYFYDQERDNYARNGEANAPDWYVRGGTLKRIDYGQRADAVYSTPPVGQVVFTVEDRCASAVNCVRSNPTNWPDTPWDQSCAAAPCTNAFSPSFWTQKRLAKITTRVLNNDGAGHRDVESWTLRHSYPDPDDGTGAAMWLEGISHAGLATTPTVTLPEVTFDGDYRYNRVDDLAAHISPLAWRRIVAVTSETGGKLGISYSLPECTRTNLPASPDSNGKRCMPVKGVDDAFPNRVDWFHKYVVTEITQTDAASALRPIVTRYEYVGAPAWHFDDIDGVVPVDKKTWAQWRGYQEVRTRTGDGLDGPVMRSDTVFFRGMDGDRTAGGGAKDVWVEDFRGPAFRYEDHDRFAGMTRQVTTYNGDGGPVLSRTIEDPWISAPTATSTKPWGTTNATRVDTAATHGYHTVSGGTRETELRKTIEADGRVSAIHDRGDVSTVDDDLCTRFEYVSNTGRNLLLLTKRVTKYAVGCDVPVTFPSDALVSDGRSFYDGSDTFGAEPTAGLVTRVDEFNGWSGAGTPNYRTASRARYDGYGRVTESTDVRGHVTRTGYTPATGGPVTRVTTTDPLGVVTYADNDPAWGAQVVDGNQTHNVRTTTALDALGRVSKVWGPTRPTSGEPDAEFGYLVRADSPVVVTTRKLQPNGNYLTKYELYDGLLRLRQTQIPAVTGGRAVADIHYDSRGLLVRRSGPYVNDAPPGFTYLNVTNEARLPNIVKTEYDGAGRPITEILSAGNGTTVTEKWRTRTVYHGDRIDSDPPAGATPTTALLDSRGRTTELWQYRGDSPTGDHDVTRYTYTRKGQQETVTDPAGNVWRTHYDALGRPDRITDPDKGEAQFTYNAYDQPETTTDSRHKTLRTTYDSFGRPTALHDVTGGASERRATWTYDTLKLGLPTSSTRWVDGDAYTTGIAEYDFALRPVRTFVSLPIGEGTLARTYESTTTYKADGSPATMSVPAAGGLPEETLTVDYNDFGLPWKLTGLSTYVTGTAYTDFAEPTSTVLSNGTRTATVSQLYDTATRRPTTSMVRTQTSGSPFINTTYSYDPAGNVTKASDTPINGNAPDHQCFRYDHLRRLTEAWTPTSGDCAAAPTVAGLGGAAPYWNSYAHDKTGNRTADTKHAAGGDTTTTYAYPAAGQPQPHTLTSTTTTGPTGTRTLTFGYDPSGNTTRRTNNGVTQDLEWDVEGALATVTEGTKETSYLDTADGDRLIRRDSTGTTVYLGGMELHRDTGGHVTATRYYSHNGQVIAVRTDSGALTWLVGDIQGTHQVAIDAASPTQAYQRRRSTPFGEERGTAPTSWAGDKGFVGGTKEPTGLTNLGAREYDPGTGRFLSVDPVIDPGDPQQMHGYAYANNNPTTFSDPDGLLYTGPDCGPDGIYCGPNHPDKPADPPPPSAGGSTNPALSEEDQRAREEAEATKQKSLLDVIKEQGLGFLMDFLGITDIINCFTKGDLGACVSTLIGFIPWGKLFKAGKAIVKGVKKAWTAYKDWQKALRLADDVIKRTDELLAAARKKADDAAEAAAKKADEAKQAGAADDAAAAGRRCETNSFTPETPVLLADGSTRPIGDIEAGDRVVATDPETGESGAQPVTTTITGEGTRVLVGLTLDIDEDAGDAPASVTATDGHPFWLPEQGRWLKAIELEPGDVLLSPDGSRVSVTAVVAYAAPATVHNLTVATTHTYYVVAGAAPVLVHNCGGGPVDNVALGRRDHGLEGFAERVGARHFLGRANENTWRRQVKRAIARTRTGEGRVSFMLDGLPGAEDGPQAALRIAMGTSRSARSHTQWELIQVGKKGLMGKVDFYRWNGGAGGWGRVNL
jgi:RHS repeat-associated protein